MGNLDPATNYAELPYAKASKTGDRMAGSQALLHRTRIYGAKGDLGRAEQMLSELEPRLRNLPPGHIAFVVLASERSLNAQAAGDLTKALELANQAVGLAQASAKTVGVSPD